MITAVLAFYYAQIALGNNSPVLIQDYVVAEAINQGVDPQIAQGIVERESRFNCKSIGDKGTSRGCWQIHLPAHKDITPKQAEDPIFSTKWALKEIKENGCGIWSTCDDTMKSLGNDT